MAGDVEVENSPSIVANDEQAVEHPEGDGRHRKEVHGGDSFAMIAQEGEPTLRGIRRSRSTPYPTGNAALGDIEAEHQEFAVNAGGMPGGILGHHPEDELADFLCHGSSADGFADARYEPPVELKSCTVPSDDGLGRYHNEGFVPRGPEATEDNPEQLVHRGKSGAAALSFEHDQLLAQG